MTEEPGWGASGAEAGASGSQSPVGLGEPGGRGRKAGAGCAGCAGGRRPRSARTRGRPLHEVGAEPRGREAGGQAACGGERAAGRRSGPLPAPGSGWTRPGHAVQSARDEFQAPAGYAGVCVEAQGTSRKVWNAVRPGACGRDRTLLAVHVQAAVQEAACVPPPPNQKRGPERSPRIDGIRGQEGHRGPSRGPPPPRRGLQGPQSEGRAPRAGRRGRRQQRKERFP